MDTTITESSIYSSCTVILVGKCLCLYLWIKIIHVTFPYETQTWQLLCQNFAHTDNPTSYVGYGSYDWDQQYTCIDMKIGLLYFLSSTLVLDKKLVHVVYSKVDRDVLVIAMPSERYFVTLLFTPV